MNIDGTEWMTVVDHDRAVNELKQQLKESTAETAAFLKWLSTQSGWEGFWADGFLGEEHVSKAKQNLQALRAFMDRKQHGMQFLKEHMTATKEIELLKSAMQKIMDSLYAVPGLMLEAEKKNPAWSRAELWGIERDIVPSLRALIVQAVQGINDERPEISRDTRQSL